jgi:hypothetical protein
MPERLKALPTTWRRAVHTNDAHVDSRAVRALPPPMPPDGIDGDVDDQVAARNVQNI